MFMRFKNRDELKKYIKRMVESLELDESNQGDVFEPKGKVGVDDGTRGNFSILRPFKMKLTPAMQSIIKTDEDVYDGDHEVVVQLHTELEPGDDGGEWQRVVSYDVIAVDGVLLSPVDAQDLKDMLGDITHKEEQEYNDRINAPHRKFADFHDLSNVGSMKSKNVSVSKLRKFIRSIVENVVNNEPTFTPTDPVSYDTGEYGNFYIIRKFSMNLTPAMQSILKTGEQTISGNHEVIVQLYTEDEVVSGQERKRIVSYDVLGVDGIILHPNDAKKLKKILGPITDEDERLYNAHIASTWQKNYYLQILRQKEYQITFCNFSDAIFLSTAL